MACRMPNKYACIKILADDAFLIRNKQNIRLKQARFVFTGTTKPNATFTSKRCRIFKSSEEAIKDVEDSVSILVGGVGLCGLPENLLRAIAKRGKQNLTIISNDCSIENYGIGWLLRNNQIKRMVTSFIGENREAERRFLSGLLTVEFVPQGTLVEKIRCGGAGIPAFYTPTGFGTHVQHGKLPAKFSTNEDHACEVQSEPREWKRFPHFNADSGYLLEMSLRADFAFIKAWKADKLGNLVFRRAARNFNAVMARAARVTIVEAEEIVEVGELESSQIHSPCIYTHRLVKGEKYEKPFQLKTVKKIAVEGAEQPVDYFVHGSNKDEKLIILRRVARELVAGMYINLGFGLPLDMINFLPKGVDITVQDEIGIMGVGTFPVEGAEDADLINAGKQTVTQVPGASFFDTSDAFGMIRGGHLDAVIHGALQVSQFGDLANWMIPGKKVNGMGSAMDTAVCPDTRVIVATLHTNKNGEPKIRKECQLPVTATRCVDRIITEKAVFDVDAEQGLTLREIATKSSLEDVRNNTGCDFKVAKDVKSMLQ